MHHIKISNFGPIEECDMDVNQFTVLTGPQASGKSTIAKAVYFFRTIKDDILDLILKNKDQTSLKEVLKKHLIKKLGSLYGMAIGEIAQAKLEYIYAEDTFIGIYVTSYVGDANVANFDFGKKIDDFFNDKSDLKYPIDEKTKNKLSEELTGIFQDDTETIYIPAGRMAVSLLSEQLNYILMSMEDTQRQTIDYCVRKYFELVLKIKSWCDKINPAIKGRSELNTAIGEFYEKIIKAEYICRNSEEHLIFGDSQSVKLNFASSGQQEAVWILNILAYFSAENKKVFLIVEEPEAHLYPKSQMYMTDGIALFVGGGDNAGLITTHSPYILGELNNLILCGQAENDGIDINSIKKASDIDDNAWLKKDVLQAFHAINGNCDNALTESGLIMNELIEGASEKIDDKCSALIDLFHGEDDK